VNGRHGPVKRKRRYSLRSSLHSLCCTDCLKAVLLTAHSVLSGNACWSHSACLHYCLVFDAGAHFAYHTCEYDCNTQGQTTQRHAFVIVDCLSLRSATRFALVCGIQSQYTHMYCSPWPATQSTHTGHSDKSHSSGHTLILGTYFRQQSHGEMLSAGAARQQFLLATFLLVLAA
jgi:hypothetical protein